MSALQTRIQKLEAASPTQADVITLIIRRLLAPGEAQAELMAVQSSDGQQFERLPDEDEDAFLERAADAARASGAAFGVVQLFECIP